ncbi:oxidoreductase- FAD-binding [Apiospora sp. TS-2023a]
MSSSTRSASWFHACAVIGCLGSANLALAAPPSLPHMHTNQINNCCQALSAAASFSSKVFMPQTAAYKASVASFWAQGEQAIAPSCVVLPQTAQDVSSAVKALVGGSCQFAVRSGGHNAVTGIANIQGGVTIDLQGLNATSLSADGSQVSIGAGQHLGNVFSMLHEHDLYLPGARASGIGAGGSTIGGGVGYLYPKTGFMADSVVEFEVVLADGSIVKANKDANPDLWRALRGGGSNYGIVTNLLVATVPGVGSVWGGDVDAAVMMSYHWSPSDGNIIDNQYVYAKPKAKPAAFAGFYAVDGMIVDATSMTTIPAMSTAQGARSPSGLQQITFSMSFKNNAQVISDVWSVFNATIPSLSAIDGVSFSLSLEPMMPAMAATSKAKGGNVMGLDNMPAEGIVVTLLSLTFNKAADYPAMDRLSEKLLMDLQGAAQKRGAAFPFVEMNHAKGSQDVLRSYGDASHDFLKATARKYDPAGVFQRLMPGGFKLCK